MKWAVGVAVVAWMFSGWILPPQLDENLQGKVAVITGGSRGSGRGFAQGLSEAGATVYITGRSLPSLQEACKSVPGPGRCIERVVDSGDDDALEKFFADFERDEGGRIDILVNNAYSGVGYWRKHALLGKPFWEQGMGLFDAVHGVGVRSHYEATLLALPMLRRAKGRGLIVNTNSAGCLLYLFNVPYGMGKCAVDKMSAGMAAELVTEGIDVVSWCAEEPMQTEEVQSGALEGTGPRRGGAPFLGQMLDAQGVGFQDLFHTALAGTLFFEGRVLAALARDTGRAGYSGLAVMTGQLAQHYGVLDERGVRAPQFTSIKFVATLLVPPLRQFAALPNPATLTSSEPTATPAQRLFFGVLPDVHLPVWLFKVLGGNPLTSQLLL